MSKSKTGMFSGNPKISIRLEKEAMEAADKAAKAAEITKAEFARDVLILELKRLGYMKN